MSGFGAGADVGDVVRTTTTVAATLTDQLIGSGLPRGTRGVVLSRAGSRLVVEFDAGWGTQRATVRSADCRLVRRGVGAPAFRRRAHRLAAARAGLALVLAWPVLQFAGEYVLEHHTVHGLLGALAVGAVQSLLDTVAGFAAHPVRSLVYFALVAVMSRCAFGRRH